MEDYPYADIFKKYLFDKYSEKGEEIICKCLFHDDKTPSLHLNMAKGIYNCFGCNAHGNIIDFVSSVEGISKEEAKEKLHIEDDSEFNTSIEQTPLHEYSILKQLPEPFLESLGIYNGHSNDILIPYFDEKGEYIAIRHRKMPKEFWWERGSKVYFYGLSNLASYNNDYIIVVEGESDTQTLWYKNIQAIGIPGAKNVNTVFRKNPDVLNKFEKIYVHRDKDEGAGKLFVKSVAKALAHKEVFEINSEALGAKDPSELYTNGMLSFDRLISTAEKVELPELEAKDSSKNIEIKGSLPLHVIAEKITAEKNIKFCKNLLYVFADGVYILNDGYIEKAIYDFDKELKKHSRTEILEYAKLICRTPAIDRDDNIINFRNGIYDLENGKLLEHNPELFLVNQVNCDYVEKATQNEYIDKFLDDITSGNEERKKAILQIIGYTCTTSMDIQKAFIFIRKGNNGKSVLVELISKLIGSDNISHVTIHDLQNGKFYAAELSNKLLNIVAELSRNHLKSVEVFKSMVTGDEISAERKYQDRFDMKPYAKNIFTANELPRVEDVTDGFYRRLNIIKFDRQFTDEERKNFQKGNLFTKEALEYLAYISVKAYKELLESKTLRLANEDESEELLSKYKKDNNSVLSFLDSARIKAMLQKGQPIDRPELYSEYKMWCADNGYKTKGRNRFYTEVQDTGLFEIKFADGYPQFRRRENNEF